MGRRKQKLKVSAKPNRGNLVKKINLIRKNEELLKKFI
jgi:hypothetical protein